MMNGASDASLQKRRKLERRLINVALVLGLFVAVAWYFSDIVIYFVMALVISAILRTPTNAIAQMQVMGYRIPRPLAILLSFGILAGVLTLFVLLFIPLISEQVRTISSLNFDAIWLKIGEPLGAIETFVLEHGLAGDEVAPGFIQDNIQSVLAGLVNDSTIKGLLNGILAVTGNIFVGLLAVVFISFFLLYEQGLLRKQILRLVPNKYFEVSFTAIYKVEKLLSSYLLGISLQMLAIFTIVSLGLLIGGIKYAATVAVFAALANLIPYLGPFLGASFGLFVGLSTMPITEPHDFLIVAIKVGVVFATVQLTDNIILQPMIFSKSVKAHPLEIFLIIFVGAGLAGAGGMILAIPVYTIVRVSISEFISGYKQYQVFKH